MPMEQARSRCGLLTTKLTPPQAYLKSIIPRARLYAQLDQAVQAPLTVITAPAGFGKTTLLGAWLRQRTAKASWTWLSLDSNDNERFWHYLIAALSTLSSRVAEQFTTWQPTPQPADTAQEILLITLSNALATLSDESILVLDNYDAITSSALQRSFACLLGHLPPQMHIILASRIKPPFPLARLRVQGRLTELDSADLRFTLDEASAFLLQGMELTLSNADIKELHRRTEGWIAGLQLAATSLQKYPEIPYHFICTFNGTERNVLHYLTDEVLLQLPVDTQRFLLATSILERMNGSLCDAVTGQTNGWTMLEQLDQANLFLITLDKQKRWYRYYHLFADMLQQRLRQRHPDLVPQFYRRASVWLEQHNLLIDAVKYAFASEDSEHIAMIVEQNVWSFIQQGDFPLLQSWLEQLPQSSYAEHPTLSCLRAWTFLMAGNSQAYEQALQLAEHSKSDQHTELTGWICALRAYKALLCSDGPSAITWAQQALQQTSEDDIRLRSRAQVSLAAGYLLHGELTRAQALLLEVSQIHAYDFDCKVVARLYLYEIQTIQGCLQSVAHALHEILLAIDIHKLHSAVAHIRLAHIYYEWNNLSAVRDHWQQDMAEISPYTSFFLLERYMLAARLARVQGDADQVIAWLDQAEQYAHRFGENAPALARITALRVQFCLEQGDVATALSWQEHYKPTLIAAMSPYEKVAWYQLQVRIHLAQGHALSAIVLLEEVLAQVKGRVGDEISLLLLLTLAYHAAGNKQNMQQTLERVLRLGESHSYIRSFVDEGTVVAELLSALYSKCRRHRSNEQQGISLSYLHNLLIAFGKDVPSPIWLVPHVSDVMQCARLSEREQTVLKLIADGLSNQQIAQQLVVTVSTIKTHLNNIYSKLNVHTRLQAVNKAYALGLLPGSEAEDCIPPRAQ